MLTYEQITGKLVSMEEADSIFTPQFRAKKRIVFTNGCFDLLHRGHVYYLSRAREMGDLLVVGLNSDRSVTRLKGAGRPVNDEKARAVVLGALAMVDFVFLFHEDTPLNLISAISPDVLVKGGDYRVEEIVGYHEVTSGGGRVVTVPLLEGYSTTSMIGRSS